MDNKRDSTESTSHLPNETQGNASTANEIPVPSANFYSSNKPPPLPSRPIPIPGGLGSGHTRYHAPPSPPTYSVGEGTPFREPELITDEPISDEDPIPALISQDGIHPQQQSAWYEEASHWDSTMWGTSRTWEGEPGWSGNLDHGDWASRLVSKKIPIDGTDEFEELNWWNTVVREKHRRPGPGVLPPLLEEMLHNSDHSLFSVQVYSPDWTGSELMSAGSSTAAAAGASRSSSQSPTSDTQQPSTSTLPSLPSTEDLIHAVPHPNAYYCRRHNGWVILQWKQSTVLPPLAKSFQEDPQRPLPDQGRRKKTQSCIEGDPGVAQGNKTHHFHLYEKALDAHKLTPAFRRQEWEMLDQVKQKKRRMTASVLNMDDLSMDAAGDDKMDEDINRDEDEGDLLDLWVCCQCSLYCVVSDVIPGVIPLKFFEEFTRNRYNNPALGKNGEESIVIGWETFLTYAVTSRSNFYFLHNCRLACLKISCGKARTVFFPLDAKGFRRKWDGIPMCASVLFEHLLLMNI